MANYKYRHRETYKGHKMDIRANTTKELNQKIQKKYKEIDANILDGNVMLSEFGMRYIETYKKPTVSAEWFDGLVLILNKHIIDGIGDKRLKDIKPIEVQQMLNNKANSFSAEYVGKIYTLTRSIFKTAHKNGLTQFDCTADLVKPSGRPAKKGKSLTPAEQKALLKVIKGHRAETLCLIMYYCGLRTKEARELKWFDIDFDKNIVHIRGTKSENADRRVPLPLEASERLSELFNGEPFENVCIANKQSANKAWRNVKRLMNIELGCKVYRNELIPPYPLQDDLRLYDLRHTYCTNLELKGVPISIASRLMGHSNIKITAAIYTHATDESIEIARNLIDGVNRDYDKICL